MILYLKWRLRERGGDINPYNFEHKIDSLHFNQNKRNLNDDFIYGDGEGGGKCN